MPLVAQIAGAVALTALLMGPWWASVPEREPVRATVPVPHPVPVQPIVAPHSPRAHQSNGHPAHLNLDVRHAFGSLDLSVSVDGKTAVAATLPGSGKRFKVFGKRAERGYTRTLDLAPGARVVRIRVRSADDKFDQSRVERFELPAASVASMTITADKSGLTLVSERPSATPLPSSPPPAPAAAPAIATASSAAATVTLPAAPAPVQAGSTSSALELLQSLRAMLIAIAGFVASAATGFIVQEYLRTRRRMFAEAEAESPKRRRAGFAG